MASSRSGTLIGILAVLVTTLNAPTLVAQTPPPMLRGRVTAVTPTDMTVDRQGTAVTVGLTTDWVLFVSEPTTIAAIKPGSFIGTTNVDSTDGGRAVEVHIFPPGVKFGEGQRTMDSGTATRMTNGTVQSATPSPTSPKAMTRMTNGTVSQAKSDTGGIEILVSFPGGERKVQVSPDAKVTTIQPVDRSLLKPGILVSTNVAPDATGKLVAHFINTGPNGTAPAR